MSEAQLPQVHCIEYFAGIGQIAGAFTCQFTAQAFDIDMDESHDLAGPKGILMALLSLFNLETGGLAHFGLICKSFCWINSGTHRRSIAFPLGRHSLEYVMQGSRLALTTAPCFDFAAFFVFALSDSKKAEPT